MVVLDYNLRSLLARRVVTLLTVLGLSLVVFVFAASLMLARGIERTLAATGSPLNAIALRQGATAEVVSFVERDKARLLSVQPEVAVDQSGAPLAAREVVTIVNLPKTTLSTGGANVGVRGIDSQSLRIHENVTVLVGRPPRPGLSEVMVGRALVGRLPGAELGQRLHFTRREWTVTGVFGARGSSFESEIWGDAEQVLAAVQRPAFSSVTLRLKDPASLEAMTKRVERDPRLALKLLGERAYYESQSHSLATFIRVFGVFVALVFSIGAALGAMITMFGQVISRRREVGTLRALGFRRSSILVGFLAESAALGLLGGVLGLGAASLLALGSFTTVNFQTMSQTVFRLALNPAIAAAALGFGLFMGVAGGVLPASKAARMEIVGALRA